MGPDPVKVVKMVVSRVYKGCSQEEKLSSERQLCGEKYFIHVRMGNEWLRPLKTIKDKRNRIASLNATLHQTSSKP